MENKGHFERIEAALVAVSEKFSLFDNLREDIKEIKTDIDKMMQKLDSTMEKTIINDQQIKYLSGNHKTFRGQILKDLESVYTKFNACKAECNSIRESFKKEIKENLSLTTTTKIQQLELRVKTQTIGIAISVIGFLVSLVLHFVLK